MKLFYQSLVVLLSFALVFIWEQSPLATYTIQVLGFLVFLFLITSARKKSFAFNSFGDGSVSIFILNTIILLLIFSTGGLSSMLFFLLYFLGFSIAFVFEPGVVFAFMLGAVLIFLPDALKNDVMSNFVKVGSLALICPLAFFFGKEFRQEEKQEKQIEEMEEKTKKAADKITEDVEEILEEEKSVLKEEDVEKLDDILEETEVLRSEK